MIFQTLYRTLDTLLCIQPRFFTSRGPYCNVFFNLKIKNRFVKYLLDNGSRPDITGSRDGQTALHKCARYRGGEGQSECAKLLHNGGANVNQQDMIGNTGELWKIIKSEFGYLKFLNLRLDNNLFFFEK